MEIDDLPSETTESTITLKWKEPDNNGKEITRYTVYQRIVTDGKQGAWIVIKNITDVTVRKSEVKLEKSKVYEFAITATNEVGESLKQDEARIQRVKATGSMLMKINYTCTLFKFQSSLSQFGIASFNVFFSCKIYFLPNIHVLLINTH